MHEGEPHEGSPAQERTEGGQTPAGDIAGEGDEGRRQADTTPPIGEHDDPDQTEHDAPPDDSGSTAEESRTE
jgi:hypothetical protein